MDVLLANSITPSMLISSTAPERLAGEVEWSDQAWSVGDLVTRATMRRVYRGAYAVPSGGVPPEENIAVAQLPYWQDLRPMNRWGMFDGRVGTQTKGTEDLTVVLRPGAVSALWLGNISNATSARVTLLNKPAGDVVFDQTYSLDHSPVAGWWDYWFGEIRQQRDLSVIGLPVYRNCELTITLSSAGDVALGMAAIGAYESLGCTEFGVNADYRNYSARALDTTWGPSQATEGVVTRDVSYRVHVRPEDAPRVSRFLDGAMKRPAVWIPSGKPIYEGIRIFGQAISARMGYPQPNYVPLDLTIREFI